MPAELSGLFAEIWKSRSNETDIRGFLEQHPEATGEQRLAVILYDQSQRWKCGKPRTAEDYLNEFPELNLDSAVKLKLIVSEFQACRECNGSITALDLNTRFPELNDDIQRELSRRDLTGQRSLPQIAFNSFFSNDTQTASPTALRPQLQTIGCYKILELIGEGGFGQVWLALDQDLNRKVAVKLAKPDRLPRLEDAGRFLEEARLLAELDHPNIVHVYHVGRLDGRFYIAFNFIDGQDLAKVLKTRRPEFREAAELIMTVALALHYAHTRGLIHRDIKPSNLLIEEKTQKVFVADFGLAVRETDYSETATLAGTPGYMSPEQARGESHRVDARCDVFALGAVLYELLTGKGAFRGSSATEILIQVVHKDPPAPRQINPQVPIELERICLKALSKRASDRYFTADEMADDLKTWHSATKALRLTDESVSIVPKGLRSFDASDASFFLSLLPGPRNRDGLPESIAFWKQRIEESNPDQSFTVGLIYGPSGCGKSSLVKAGLIPCLCKHTVTVYVEASADNTETSILQGLRNRMQELPRNQSLVETLGSIRRGNGYKVVIFIDQFEQWLHAHRTESDPELVTALRQCDGARLQAIVMVRDDFWLAVSRFMNQVEINLNQGVNIRLVDLFDTDHAVKVLTRIGQAYQKLPAAEEDITGSQREFLTKAMQGLLEDGRVVSVRLALFGEMVKGKSWQPEILSDMGGTEGICIAFLEETFSSRFANPKHRQHQKAARAVLAALLPELGTDIKGHMRSQQELQEAAGLQNRPGDFDDLLCILDSELRLITPTDPESDSLNDSSRQSPLATRYYQLTHDYLVASLREWLTSKRKETRSGRAEIVLLVRTAITTSRSEPRYLASTLELLQIAVFTSWKQWTPSQRRMLLRSLQRRSINWLSIATTLLAAAFVIWHSTSKRESRLQNQITYQAHLNSMQENARFIALAQGARFMDAVAGIERKLSVNTEDASLKYDAACVYSLAAKTLEGNPRATNKEAEAVLIDNWKGQAIRLLESLFEDHYFETPDHRQNFMTDPDFEFLRSDARFIEFVVVLRSGRSG
jgi:serine/threonine protein kinase